ncbi:hypothetical protein LOAG_06684 [Loa loa]|uniref:Uncharacterized protein n=1 Tax=Loa loa TaxID=7209 RepID=A0A1S0TXW3_LOALO|nr:hypothetical protein LOAG_06684 [Loa loa]EFO21798.1 hypothetical protein LOAG_06684 [Loa loa]
MGKERCPEYPKKVVVRIISHHSSFMHGPVAKYIFKFLHNGRKKERERIIAGNLLIESLMPLNLSNLTFIDGRFGRYIPNSLVARAVELSFCRFSAVESLW